MQEPEASERSETALVDPERHVESFRQAREARRLELVEDYVELIDDLIGDGGEARQVDIAARLGVAQPTVAKMLRRLCDEGLVQQRPYRGVFPHGGRQAAGGRGAGAPPDRGAVPLRARRQPETARRDAEGIDTMSAPRRWRRFAPSPRGGVGRGLQADRQGRRAERPRPPPTPACGDRGGIRSASPIPGALLRGLRCAPAPQDEVEGGKKVRNDPLPGEGAHILSRGFPATVHPLTPPARPPSARSPVITARRMSASASPGWGTTPTRAA